MVWTSEEIKTYAQVGSAFLDGVYAADGKTPDDPEERARYLAEEVLGGLTMTDDELLMRVAADEGRPAALNLLEGMVLSHFILDAA